MFEDLPLFIEISIIAILGLTSGSFATALTYRVPKGIPWAFNTNKDEASAYFSSCPKCEKRLKFLDLVPIFSWSFNKGQCRHCKAPIGFAYPAIELTSLTMMVMAYTALGFSWPLLWIGLAIPFLVALMAIDIKHLILPNQLVLIVFILGLIYQLSRFASGIITVETLIFVYGAGALVYAFFSWFLGFLMSKIKKREALGLGDVKFFACAGIWLGVLQLPYFCLFSGVLGVFLALLWRILFKTPVFPFGPALILGLFALFILQGSHWPEFILK